MRKVRTSRVIRIWGNQLERSGSEQAQRLIPVGAMLRVIAVRARGRTLVNVFIDFCFHLGGSNSLYDVTQL